MRVRPLFRPLLVCAVSLLVSACQGVVPEAELSSASPLARNEAALYPIEDCPIQEVPGQYVPPNCPTQEYCGNNICEGNESADTCPQDCTYCGDGQCNGWEGTTSCPQDCGSSCGDGVCNGGETVSGCRVDCGPKLRGAVLERVRRCRNSTFCNSTQTQAEYHWWDDFNVADEKQKETYIAQPLRPPRGDVRHLVLMLAGQQFGSGYWSGLTGQSDDYKDAFGKKDGSHWVNLNPDSLATHLVEDPGGRSPQDTYLGLAFDARFNYGFTPSNKQEIENAYYEWLKEKAYLWNLQSIYLAGHSRGGCLAARLARRFKQEAPNTPVILHLFDAVCDGDDGEFGTWEAAIDNPVSDESERFGYSTDFSAQFPTTYNLAVYNMISGGQVLGSGLADGIETARAMSQYQASSASYGIGDWYTQRWFDYGHSSMSGLYWEALWHYRSSCSRFGC